MGSALPKGGALSNAFCYQAIFSKALELLLDPNIANGAFRDIRGNEMQIFLP